MAPMAASTVKARLVSGSATPSSSRLQLLGATSYGAQHAAPAQEYMHMCAAARYEVHAHDAMWTSIWQTSRAGTARAHWLDFLMRITKSKYFLMRIKKTN